MYFPRRSIDVRLLALVLCGLRPAMTFQHEIVWRGPFCTRPQTMMQGPADTRSLSVLSPRTIQPRHFAEQGHKPDNPAPGLLRRYFPNFPWQSLPNWLTYMRCAAIPGLIALFQSSRIGASTIFVAASITDWLDGFLARRWNVCSDFGAFLDPVADKLMVACTLILLSGRYGNTVALPTCIILMREIAVSALREWMAGRGLRDSVQVGWQGKCKTALTMVTLSLFLLVRQPYSTLFWVSLTLLYGSTLLTVTSGSVYFGAAAPVLLGGTVRADNRE